jgi:hypothetical protein
MTPRLRPPQLRVNLLDLLQLRVDRRGLGREREERSVLRLEGCVDACKSRTMLKMRAGGETDGRTVWRILRLAGGRGKLTLDLLWRASAS